jgi:CubicO group peptidase (beta-lactamase class C family)
VQDDARGAIADRILAELQAVSGVPGLSAAVAQDGALLWSGGAGHRDVECGLPVTPETTFRIASVSKLLTVTVAAVLAEEGRLSLDAPTELDGLRSDWRAITPRQLAAHISGIPHYQPIDQGLGNVRYGGMREAIDIFRARDLLFAPGEGYAYSSFGYTLLSAAVEARAGAPFLDFVRQRVTGDLRIAPDMAERLDANASLAYAFGAEGPRLAPAHDYSYSWGGAGFRASAPALARFGDNLMAGDIVSPASLEMMWTPTQLGDGEIVANEGYQVGFGWRIEHDEAGRRIVHHSGLAIGARSSLALIPELRLSASILSNAMWTSSIDQTALTFAALFEHRPEDTTQVACPVSASRFEGEWDGARIAGDVRFRLEQGLCAGELSADNALGAWMNGFAQNDASRLPVVAFEADGGLTRAALVTPIGAFTMHAEGAALRARIGRSRVLTLRIQ